MAEEDKLPDTPNADIFGDRSKVILTTRRAHEFMKHVEKLTDDDACNIILPSVQFVGDVVRFLIFCELVLTFGFPSPSPLYFYRSE